MRSLTHHYWLLYVLLALIILFPLLKPGYILTLDMHWTPQLKFPSEVNSNYVLKLLLYALNQFIAGDVLQKSVLMFQLILMGTGMHRLIMTTQKPDYHWAGWFGGVLYMLNPFTYSRFMDGQWYILFGYALLPFFVHALYSFWKHAYWKSALVLSFWSVAISIVSIHYIYMLAMLVIASSVSYVWQQRKNPGLITNTLGWLMGILLVCILASSYWLIPLLTGQSTQSQLFSTFDDRHLLSFRTVSDKQFGMPLNVLGLYGYWGDREARYIVPKDTNPAWPIVLVLIFVVVGIGIRRSCANNPMFSFALVSVMLAAWLLAMGITGPVVAPVNRWLVEHLPWFSGYREPQKFIALLALGYAYFGGAGVASVFTHLQSKYSRTSIGESVAIGLLMLPVLYTLPMLWGFAGQLKSVDYPPDWYHINEQLQQDEDTFKVLFLPWHKYLYLSFSERVVINPAQAFFSVPIIQGNNPEIGLIYSDLIQDEEQFIQTQILDVSSQHTSMGHTLAARNIKYVLLAKEADWQEYDFLDTQSDLKLVEDTTTLKLYKNTSYEEAQNP